MTTKKGVFIVVLCAFVATPVMADPFGHGAGYDGGTANYSRTPGYGNTYGGEFTMEGPGLLLSNSAYDPSTRGVGSDTGSFQSFCVEYHESVFEPMRIWVSEENIDQSMPGSHAYYGGVYKTGDDLDPMTAFLYTQFATGTLSLGGHSYEYTPGPGRENSAKQLQYAIWAIEGERPLTGSDTIAQDWVNAVPAAMFDAGWSESEIGNVRVLQTYRYWGGQCYSVKQDQLYLTPVPGAAILGILGLCVGGWKLRKFA